jgi:hypothetical protein
MTTSSREEEIRQDIERTREQLGDTALMPLWMSSS